MTTALQNIITATRALSARDKLELLQVISHDLQQTFDFAEATAQFLGRQSITDLVHTDSGVVVTDVQSLKVDFWPENETADDINAFVAAQRKADRLR